MPSVVAIDVRGEQSYTSIFGYSQKYETEGAGSGILIGENDEEYLIVTNNHVVENTKSMSVQFIDGESVEAELKGTDSGKDVAVISVKKENVKDSTKGAIALAEIGDSDSLKVGQGVIAIGNALGYGQSVTVGYISALNRTITAMDSTTGQNAKVENLLQTDAAINPGNSGGALLDMDGRVIGINESKSVDTTVEGMGYAIPISSVTELIDTLSSQKTRSKVAEENRGYLGIQCQNVDSDAAQRFSMPIGIFVRSRYPTAEM
jgi:serine protease Do